jgi:ABC-type multidrug transport system ATPase subunit
VDVAARSEIWEMLEAEKARALVLISTSYLDEAAACDRLLYLDGGRVLAIGAPADLCARTTLELFRVWGEDSKRTSRAARELGYVRASRACAGYARVEVRAEGAPSEEDILRDLAALDGARFAERTPVDMESTLLALARGADRP